MSLVAEIIGYIAAVVGTSLMLPQVVKSFRTRSVGDLSWGMIWLYFFNCALWLTYGILIVAMPLILCNFIALLISIVQLGLKFRFQRQGS